MGSGVLPGEIVGADVDVFLPDLEAEWDKSPKLNRHYSNACMIDLGQTCLRFYSCI
jgi:hypothetical protein